MDAEIGCGFEIAKYSFRCGQMHLKGLNVVATESSDTEGDVWSASKCGIHQGSNYREIFFSINGFVLAVGVVQVNFRIELRFC